MFQFSGFNLFRDVGRTFSETYMCFSVSMLPGNERQDVETGGKIILPSSALSHLTRLNVVYPMLFKLSNKRMSRTSHAGVLEFVADEGKCYLPHWMMNNLLLGEGDAVSVESVSLKVASFSKFQPQHTDFLDITNPKAVLENALRNFACLTTGDVIAINYNRRVYELLVLETKPGNAVSIIECDMNVEFEAPVGYKEPENKANVNQVEKPKIYEMEEIYDPFKGPGNRLDGKKKKLSMEAPVMKRTVARGVPDYDYQFGTLTFDRSVKPISDRVEDLEVEVQDVDSFKGQGFSLKPRK